MHLHNNKEEFIFVTTHSCAYFIENYRYIFGGRKMIWLSVILLGLTKPTASQ